MNSLQPTTIKKFVSPEWLNAHQQPCLIVEASSNSLSDYHTGHIPRAVYLDTNALERPPLWNRISDNQLEAVLLEHGIVSDITVILYARGSTAAARAAVILLYAGVKDVRLLDGGFQNWESSGFPVEPGENLPVPAPTFGAQVPARRDYFVDADMVKTRLKEKNSAIVSVRSWAEHIGETSGYDFITPKGRIAGSVWGHAGSDKDHMEHYRYPDRRSRPFDEIAANWHRYGITPDKYVIFYCGTGWRASEAFFHAHAMGWKNIAVYDGGWLEWSSDPANPIETGEPVSSQT